MKADEYLQKLIRQYEGSFDISNDYEVKGLNHAAYGYFNSHSEKYILTKEVQMWEVNNHEHIFFRKLPILTKMDFDWMDEMFQDFAEPVLVRKEEPLPPKNHMYSYLTYIFITEGSVDQALVKMIRKYRYSKTYLFSLRGWCDARVIVIDLAENRLYANKQAKPILRLYKKILKE